jgi:hypothetical protein
MTFNASLCECHLRPVCDCCQREVERVRGSVWHGTSRLCPECFGQWYDPDNESVDPTDPISIGNAIRRRHGLPALEPKP